MSAEIMVEAYLDDYNLITVGINRQFCGGKSEHFYLLDGDRSYELSIISRSELERSCVYKLDSVPALTIGKEYELMCVNAYRVPLQYRFITKTKRFNEEFEYYGHDLGNHVVNDQTSFKVWAPTAASVTVMLQQHGGVSYLPMSRGDYGVWSLVVDQDLTLASYTYLTKVNGRFTQATDPYGKLSTPNSKATVIYPEIRNEDRIVMNPDSDYTKAVIYEVSIRDFTEEGTFKSFEENLDYIADLGVSHIQLLPVNDFGSVDEFHKDYYYNWGYDPVQYQCLEGSYSSDVYNPVQVTKDFIGLINTAHQKGLKVVLDVVYNHHYNFELSNFNSLVPYYYFRYNSDGRKSDGTFCGSEFDTEMNMCRKYFVDTVIYYVRNYDVDGYRFDLMGILDVQTINTMRQQLKRYKQDIMMYGEGWSLPTCLPTAQQSITPNRGSLPGIAFFNDQFRDVIKGSTFDSYEKGYSGGNTSFIEKAKSAFAGRFYESVNQSINYVECHDNMTSYDKLKMCCAEESKQQIIDRVRLMMAMVIFSQGIPFIHAGQECCYSKRGINNSYNAPDSINKLKKEQREKYKDVAQYTKQLIEIRRKYHLDDASNVVTFETDMGVLICHINDVTIIFNPTTVNYMFTENYGTVILGNKEIKCADAISTTVLVK